MLHASLIQKLLYCKKTHKMDNLAIFWFMWNYLGNDVQSKISDALKFWEAVCIITL